MDAQRPNSPAAAESIDDSALLSTHVIPHSASEPPKMASDSDALQASTAANGRIQGEEERSDTPLKQTQSPASHPSPPAVSNTDHEAFSALRPTPSNQHREVVAYTAAAAARVRSLDQHGNFEKEHDPNRRSSIASSATSPATLIKNLPDAASKTLNTTIAAPARTLDSIKAKLQSPSTGQKSKSDIPNSLGQVEHDMRHNQDAPGNLSPGPTSPDKRLNKSKSDARPAKSDSFNSFLGGKSKHPNSISALMQRGPRKSDSSTRSGSALSPRNSAIRARAPRRKGSAIQEDTDGEYESDNGPREEEEEEDEEVVRQRIKDQQKRLEELDEAQTVGLLRTQQEAGIEPPQSPESPTKPSWLVGLPLFGNGSGSGKAKQDGSQGAENVSRSSSFHLSRGNRRQQTQEFEAEAADSSGRSAGLTDGPRRTNSEKLKGASRGRQGHARSASASRAARSKSRPRDDGAPSRRGSGVMSPARRQSTTWTSKLRTKIPIKEFPLQGSGRESEFNQECPLWARQPWKYMYFSYFGLSVGLYHLPRWAVSSILPSHRGRPDWSWKKATMVKLFRHGTQLTFRTRTSLGRDLQKEVPHSKTVRCKFTWVDPVADEDVRGELRRAMLMQKVHPQRTCGFWYGDVAEQAKASKHRHRHRRHSHRNNDGQPEDAQPSANGADVNTPMQEEAEPLGESTASLGAASRNTEQGSQKEAMGGVGRPAEPGEKVLYHLHGGAYWIGTAHEKDVTAAVNTESLRYMAEIYKQKEAEQKKASGNGSTASGLSQDASSSSSTSRSGASSTASSSPYKGKLLRSFSLDYRLCVPGRPRAGSYPAALLDALSGYLYLVRELGFKEENIIVAGDSAGGNLGLALCRYLRDEREEIAKQPGSLLLMSPWVDVSRSHSGPTGAPNMDSTVYLNQKSDIISSMLAFRNTAVSAFLGDLPARETYRNPYISPVSLQLPLERGGKAPHYGFHGFPKRIYITTGSAEISYDQHLTLAHRLAAGTNRGRPVYSGDRLSAGCNAREMAERRNRPRPKEMLDADQNSISVTPAGELDGMQFSSPEPSGRKEEGKFAMQVIDGEPTPSTQHQHSSSSSSNNNNNNYNPTSQDNSTNTLAESSTHSTSGKQRLYACPPEEPPTRENREVVLDEVKDAIHDYLLFKWFEPERSCTWRRIAEWIDES
ncbi:uncharacterized protein UTRI_01466_B [Ustilago trichophora]|uniref:Alpha/beta hydrolase fold-3 domain-containing protein n=1 Tax=Ustilago trichophora TaxID=86804 RepID=A0A5C3E5V7_9BASI|nr:uncharacterized protein UTRI_01466_B [Ustilago trichophora]